MSNRILPPPFLSEPPIYDDFLDEEGNITYAWVNWLNSITRVTGYNIVHDYAINASGERDDINLLQVTSLTTPQRNSLENARDGTAIYNSTTGRMNFREGGSWVTYTAIPA
jgi:hypothetical protein